MATRKVSSQLLKLFLYSSKNPQVMHVHGVTWSSLALTLVLLSILFILPFNATYAGQATFAWDRNAEPNVAGYKIYYGTSSRNYDWFIDVGDVTSFTVTNLSDGVTYFFAATAYDTTIPPIESPYSEEASKNMCFYSISPTNETFNASGGTGSVSITTQAGCHWSASSGATWMTITSGSTGTGNGSITYSIEANTTGSFRIAGSTIAGSVFTVNQSGASTYTLTASGGVGGTISPSGTISVNHGSNQTFTITPNTGYTISNVAVDGISVGAVSSYTFSNITASHTISATFSVRTYTLTSSAGTGGTISPKGSTTVNHGENQAYLIIPNNGYSIANVVVDGISVGAVNSYTFGNITANHTISATFTAQTFTISALAGSGGTISPSGNVLVPYGGNKLFTIIPVSGYAVADVLVDGVSQGSVGSFTFNNVTSNHTVSARFSQITYTIDATAGTGGTISPAGSVTVGQGTNQTFTITPESGYLVSDVFVDGSSIGALRSYTFTTVSSSHVISARFVQGYTLEVNIAGTGRGDVIKSPSAMTYAPGAKVTLRAEKDVSSVFEGFSGDCATSKTSCTVIMNKNAAVTVLFKLKTLKVKTTVIGNGSITIEEPASNQDTNNEKQGVKKDKKRKRLVRVNRSRHDTNLDYGDQLVYNIMPEPGSYLKKVWVDGKPYDQVETLTFTEIKRNHNIIVRFEVEEKDKPNNKLEFIKHHVSLQDDDHNQQQAVSELFDDSDVSPIGHLSTSSFASIGQ